jgi:hypothetical protein
MLGQFTACNRVHSVYERAARWILMTQDRVGEDTFPMTHELLATMLGSRRSGVTIAAATLQKAGGLWLEFVGSLRRAYAMVLSCQDDFSGGLLPRNDRAEIKRRAWRSAPNGLRWPAWLAVAVAQGVSRSVLHPARTGTSASTPTR